MILEIVLVVAVVPAEIDPVRNAVLCAEAGFSRSVENRDFDAFLDFLDPEVRFITGRISRGPVEVGQGWAGFFKEDGPKMRWRPSIVEVVSNGTLAIGRGPYRLTRKSESGETTHTWGTFNSTWRLTGDGMCCSMPGVITAWNRPQKRSRSSTASPTVPSQS